MFDAIGQMVKVFSQMRLGPWCHIGNVLLAGEGNLSFAKSLLGLPETQITHMTATTYEKLRTLSDDAIRNTHKLKQCGVRVLHDIDAVKLDQSFSRKEFDTIIFQFPNVGSREAKYGRNPNYVLIRKFLRSAKNCLKPSGKVMITAVDSPHYEGAFQFEEAAKFAGFEAPEIYPFDPSLFSGYVHTNTNDDDSALEDHIKFVTWVFKVKDA